MQAGDPAAKQPANNVSSDQEEDVQNVESDKNDNETMALTAESGMQIVESHGTAKETSSLGKHLQSDVQTMEHCADVETGDQISANQVIAMEKENSQTKAAQSNNDLEEKKMVTLVAEEKSNQKEEGVDDADDKKSNDNVNIVEVKDERQKVPENVADAETIINSEQIEKHSTALEPDSDKVNELSGEVSERKLEQMKLDEETEQKSNIVSDQLVEKMEVDVKEEKNSLWISNLSNSAKAADLKTLFVEFGKVMTAKIFTTRNANSPSCYGFVTMSDSNSALQAKTKLDRTNFKGKVISIDTVARTPTPSRSTITPQEVTNLSEEQQLVSSTTTTAVASNEQATAGSAKASTVSKGDTDVEVIETSQEKADCKNTKKESTDAQKLHSASNATKSVEFKPQSAKGTTNAKILTTKAGKKVDGKTPVKAPNSSIPSYSRASKSSRSGDTSKSHVISKPAGTSRSNIRRFSPVKRSSVSIRHSSKILYSNSRQRESRDVRSVVNRKFDTRNSVRRRPIRYTTSPPKDSYDMRRVVIKPSYSRPTITGPVSEPIYSQQQVIKMVTEADHARKVREDAIERARQRTEIELEKTLLEKEKLEILRAKEKLELEQMRLELRQARENMRKSQHQDASLATSYGSSKTSGERSSSSFSSRDKRSTLRIKSGNYRPTDSSSSRRRSRSRSPHRSSGATSGRDQKLIDSYHERLHGTSGRAHRPEKSYSSRSSTRPSLQSMSLSNNNSAYASTNPVQQSLTANRYDQNRIMNESSSIYEKRLAAMKDGYNAPVELVYSDRKKDAYSSYSSSRGAGDTCVSGAGSLSSYSRPEIEAGYGLASSSSSYSRTAAASAAENHRYEQVYSSAQNYSSSGHPSGMIQQQPPWNNSTATSAWSRQLGSDWQTNTNSYDLGNSAQYEYVSRRF